MNDKSNKILGEGSYGQVKQKGNIAVKSFKKVSHICQEYLAGKILKDVPYIIDVLDADVFHKTLDMKLYDGSLRKIFYEEENWSWVDEEMKMEILRQILLGLAQLHVRGLCHADLKPGNIMYKIDGLGKIHVYLGDLGFVSRGSYSKCHRTAAMFRDINVVPGWWHDIYGLGIMCFELFSDLRLNSQIKSYKQLHNTVKKNLGPINQNMCNLILEMTHKVHSSRPTALSLLKRIFNENPKIQVPRHILDEYSQTITTKNDKTINDFIFECCEKYHIGKPKRAIKAVKHYINKRNIRPKNYQLFVGAMVFIISSVFGENNISDQVLESKILHSTYTRTEILDAISAILKDDDMGKILLLS